ncbi:NAD(P)-dependent malic enzyme [Corynebacterium frankenforstense]
MDLNDLSLKLHREHHGKIATALRDSGPITREKLSAYYSPGVAAACEEIAAEPARLRELTWTGNLVAVVSDGSAVLGLGNIGPKAAMPVMEGKAMLFKHFAGVDCVPVVLDVHTADEIVTAVKAIAPSFGAVNLEDIAAPVCFEVEARLREELDIPVLHDDQHGTAVVVLAGLINACKVTERRLADTRIVMVGAGAAGVAIATLLHEYAGPEIIAVDSRGVISRRRDHLNEHKERLAGYHDSAASTLQDALEGADAVIGISHKGLLARGDIMRMNRDAIVFALANPDPEITPEEARAGGAAVIATGRGDYPNQVNNAVAFPGIFRGALDHGVTRFTRKHLMRAAEALASAVVDASPEKIIPSVFDANVVPSVARVFRGPVG